VHLTAKFHHPTLSRSEVVVRTDKLTDKQTDAAENIHLASLRYDGGERKQISIDISKYNEQTVGYHGIALRVIFTSAKEDM